MLNKRAESSDNIVLETTIFIILNLVFFAAMLYFVNSSAQKAFVYEQTYSKEIALLIDSANPDMAISLDISKLVSIAEKNNVDKNKIVRIDEKENKITVSLNTRSGYSYTYFSDYNVLTSVSSDNMLIIKIKNKEPLA
ncbi:MAG: hypothetical protein Q7S33_05910 [Nanoarchaeota archaeon]|nr:hypothetical protein [Nanoarchaeota archaeon]